MTRLHLNLMKRESCKSQHPFPLDGERMGRGWTAFFAVIFALTTFTPAALAASIDFMSTSQTSGTTTQTQPTTSPYGQPVPGVTTTPAPGTTTVPGATTAPRPGTSVAPAPAVFPPSTLLAPAQPAAPGSPAAPEIRTQPPQFFDYSANLRSDVFGANLFTGAFARQGATQFNPDYAVAVGDNIQVRLWGAFQYDATLTVDPKGNIFLPHLGPVQILSVRNQDLQRVVESAASKVFRANVSVYASLSAAQPVRIFVGGFVYRPGLYSGTSMDSLLHFLDQAGGIDPERGSFLDVQVKRGSQVRANVNLYEFLLDGRMPVIQLADGDVIFVTPRKNTVKVSGLAENAKRFEFRTIDARTVADLVRVAKPLAQATHVRVVRNTGTIKNIEYYPLEEAASVRLENGDEMEFTADRRPGTITVRVEGEHQSAQEYVLPYGSRIGDLIKQVQFTERSDSENVQLFRPSVQVRQKLALEQSLNKLEATILTAPSGSTEEAQLRNEEAKLMLQWVERARKIEPLGQVVIAQAKQRDELLLESGDIFRVPAKDGLVIVSGEVLFPNAVTYEAGFDIDDYIKRSGGYTQSADSSRILIARRDGSFDEAEWGSTIRPGDEILVLAKVDTKPRQFWIDITRIVFQLALAAKVVID